MHLSSQIMRLSPATSNPLQNTPYSSILLSLSQFGHNNWKKTDNHVIHLVDFIRFLNSISSDQKIKIYWLFSIHRVKHINWQWSEIQTQVCCSAEPHISHNLHLTFIQWKFDTHKFPIFNCFITFDLMLGWSWLLNSHFNVKFIIVNANFWWRPEEDTMASWAIAAFVKSPSNVVSYGSHPLPVK